MKNSVGTFALLIATTLAGMDTAQATAPNHLGGQSSVYLARAAGQPVDWYPWGAEAFKRAKELDRPILLDVGAVWCPWCGLMDRDTYTNPETAEYVNQHFVAVKVDFDASPKLVAELQRAQAVLNLPAGLPLTSFITPDGKLYFGAGYLPSEGKGGKQSFKDAAEQALQNTQTKERLMTNRSNWRLRSDQKKHISWAVLCSWSAHKRCSELTT